VSVRGDGKGEGVLDHALAVAKRFNAHISVMHTHAKPEDLLPFGSLAITEDMCKQIIESATTSAATEELRLKEFLMNYLKSRDIPMVDTPGADVLVMGGYGHSRARQLVMGGVTSHIIKAAEMPVILVP